MIRPKAVGFVATCAPNVIYNPQLVLILNYSVVSPLTHQCTYTAMMSSFLFLKLLFLCFIQPITCINYVVFSNTDPREQNQIEQVFHDVEPGYCCIPLNLYSLSVGLRWNFEPKVAYFYQSHSEDRQYNVFQTTPSCAGAPAERVLNAPEHWFSTGRYQKISGATVGVEAARSLKIPNEISLGYGGYKLEQQTPGMARYIRFQGEGPLSLMARADNGVGKAVLGF